MQQLNIELLMQCPLFRGIAYEELESILEQAGFRVKRFAKESLIASRGDECNNLMIVAEGSVKGEMMDQSGKVIKIEDIPAPRPLAPAFIFGQNNLCPVDIVANEDATLLILPKPAFLKLMQQHVQVLQNYLNVVSSRAQFLSQKIYFLSFQSLKGKIAHYILGLMKKGSRLVDLKLTQRELSEMFGVARPSLARALSEMEKEGVIRSERKEVEVLDKIRLMEMVRE